MSLGDLTGQIVADLRNRLLDLRNSNKLLNYRHSERSKTQVRIVDELPDFLHESLTTGKSLSFRSLPEPNNALPDEKTDDFLMALEEARRLDERWSALLKEEEDITSDKALRLERSIRDRVRADMGLPPAKGGRLISMADWARLNGIEPSFDLPVPSSATEAEEKYSDNEIQTLLLPDVMQNKLAGVLDHAKTAQQEMGVNLLYVAIGFLEWVEAPQAEKPMIAPLLLYPVDLDRKPMKAKAQYSYLVRGDSEPIINISLRQRLAKENLIVPELEEGDTAETYLAKIAKVIEKIPRWKVRRFATLGLFSFSRIVMYNDLDPSKWSGQGGLPCAGVLGDLFGRKESGDPTAESHDIEDPAVEAELPVLIRDADSSQHQAIIDVMRGRNLVIKGPPGTGKSQTITNIIAAALAKNQHVLFVAEKAAALDVVKKRLDDAGLGEFCFELHSTKAKKIQVLASLERRIGLISGASKSSAEAALTELRRLRERLAKHALVMNLPFSAMEINERGVWRRATVHDILWAEQRTRNVAPRFLGLERVFLPNALETTRFDVERRRDRLEAIERIVAEIIQQFGGLMAHPWFFVTRPTIQVLEVPEILDAAEQVKLALDMLGQVVSSVLVLAIRVPGSPSIIKACAQTLASLPIPDTKSIDDLLRRILVDGCCEEGVSAIANDLEARFEALAERDRRLVSGATSLTAASAGSLARQAKDLGVADLTLDQLAKKLTEARAELATCYKINSLATSFLDILGISGPPTPRVLVLAVRAVEMLSKTDRPTLLGRLPSVIEETAQGILQDGCSRIADLRVCDAELRKRFVFDGSISFVELRRNAGVLKTTGLLGRLGGEFKAAKKTSLALFKGSEALSGAQMAERLMELADYLEARQAFEGDQALRAICQHRFMGLDTDLNALLAANRFSAEVRSAFAGLGDAEMAVRRFLLQGELERLDGLKALAADDRFEYFRAAILEASNPDVDLVERYRSRERVTVELETLHSALSAGGLRADATPAQAEEILPLLERIKNLETNLSASQGQLLMGDYWRGVDTDPAALRATIVSARAIRTHAPDNGICEAIAVQPEAKGFVHKLRLMGMEMEAQASHVMGHLNSLLRRTGEDSTVDQKVERLCQMTVADLTSLLAKAVAGHNDLIQWTTLRRGITDARGDGLVPLLDAYDEANEPYLNIVDAYNRVLYRSLARRVMEEHPVLGESHALSLDDIRRRFQDLDKRILNMRRLDLIASLSSVPIPQGIQSPKKQECTEATLIGNEIAKKKKHIPLRDLIDRASNAIRALKPCAMMSPSSVAQFLKPDHCFDLVIIDEASQMRPEEAISALARAKQAVIVGDPKQLPPTTFFDRQDDDDQSNEDEEFEKVVVESVLDLARTAFQPSRELLWHYRSRHGSLISFSNRHFYDDRLIVFPSPQEGHPDWGVKLVSVAGQYRASVNVPEVSAVTLAAVEFMTNNPDKSLGIVALNQPQRDLILAEMDRLFVRDTLAERYRARWATTLEPFFVKNLENVQGDERDVIFISTVYGPDEAGNLMQRFGPINSAAGDRRLNVLFSRAKYGVTVFSSMRPDQIRADNNTPRGTLLLKDYLTFAATGKLDIGTRTYQDCDSDFEWFVKEQLEAKGYEVVAQVGVAGFRIDLGVRHPEWPFGFLLGIECDGASYHSSRSARDRDRLRQQVLESLGWTIYRVWSTDWFRDQKREVAKMVAFIDQTLRDSLLRHREAIAKQEILIREQEMGLEAEDTSSTFLDSFEDPDHHKEDTNSSNKTKGGLGEYKEATYDDLDLPIASDRFFDRDYKTTLVQLIERCVIVEGPIRDDVLARRIGRLHGFHKAGSRIREHVGSIAARRYQTTKEGDDRFFWPPGVSPEAWHTFRCPKGEARPVDEIALEELRALALVVRAQRIAGNENQLVSMSRIAGLQRLRASSRERLAAAMDLLKADVAI